MQHTYREMHSPGEALGKDHIEVKGNKLCGGQMVRTLEGENN